MNDIIDKIKNIKSKAIEEIKNATDLDNIYSLEKKYLGRKGYIADFYKKMKDFAQDERPEIGKIINEAKSAIVSAVDDVKRSFDNISEKLSDIDLTLPSSAEETANIHPVTYLRWKVEDIFTRLGFSIVDGYEVEDDWHNFTALNIPEWHSARDMQDTFYVNQQRDDDRKTVLRTHTSPLQIRSMLKMGAPLKIIAPGKVYRNEATDARHETTFWQVEGLYVDKNVSLKHLIQVLDKAIKLILGKDVKIRWRPGYFPFVEPGVEIDIECLLCSGAGCNVCKKTGWLEFSGAGMVHPNVFKSVGIDPDEWSGFAFGFGLTRLAMLKWGIDDVRLLLSGDLRFLKQFKKLSV